MAPVRRMLPASMPAIPADADLPGIDPRTPMAFVVDAATAVGAVQAALARG